MKRIDVSSSNVAQIGYDEESQKMEVAYHGTSRNPKCSVYSYYPVTLEEYNDICGSSSIGGSVYSLVRSKDIGCFRLIDEIDDAS